MSVPVLCKTEEIIVDTTDYNSDDAIENEEHLRITLEDTGGEYHTYHTTASDNQITTKTITTVNSPPRNRNNNNGGGGNIMSSSTTPASSSAAVTHHLITPSGKSGTKNLMESEKRMRREIANSNERRRMQSINAGFQSLRSLLPHHEGEKLSKAAILQQTAQYIIELEREKTHLLSQNSQLKRLLGQHEVGGGGGGGGGETTTTTATGNVAIKKRKFADNVVTVQTISDSSDEGLGSMSPEPVTLLNSATGVTKTTTAVATAYLNVNTKELSELKSRLEAERSRRTLLEDRLRQLERQIYPSSNQYIHREVIEHTDNLREEDIPMSFTPVQVVEIDSIPSVGQTQVVVCHSLDDSTMTADEEEVISGDLISNVREEIVIGDESSRDYVELPSRLQPILEAAIKAEPKVEVERINSTLTKIKPDDKKVENNNSNGNTNNKQASSRRMYITNTSRQNLETIVEAIRHLEGDHLFAENVSESKKSVSPTTVTVTSQPQQQQQQHPQQKTVTISQELPLALTTTNKPTTVTVTQQQQHRKLPVELAPFLQPKKQTTANTVTIVGSVANVTAANTISNNNPSGIATTNSASSTNVIGGSNIVTLKTSESGVTTTLPQQIRITGVASLKQCRPGVIVAKQVS